MGNNLKGAETEPVEELNATKRAYELWAKIRRYSSLIARLKLSTGNSKTGLQKRKVSALEAGEKEPFWQRIVIEPDNENKKIFDLFIAFCSIMDFLFSSYTFLIDQSYLILVHLLSGILFVDILLRFIHGYFVGRAQITDIKVVVIHYLSTYFLFDLLSTLPFYVFNPYLFWLRLLRLVRFQESNVRIADFIIHKLIERMWPASRQTLAAIERLLKFIVTLLVFLHIFACAWSNLGWEPEGWVSVKEDYLPDKKESTVYLVSLYWAISTFATVGYGDFTGATTNDYLFTMGVFLFGVCMFSYLMGNVNGLVTQLSYESQLAGKQEEELENWLFRMDRAVRTQMSSKQCDFVVEYLQNYWGKNIKGIDSASEFVVQLPPGLRKKLFGEHLFEDVHQRFIPFFDGLAPDFAKQLVLKMQYRKIMKENDYQVRDIVVLKAGKVPSAIYFVKSKSLRIGSVDTMTKYVSLGPGGVFGEVYVLFGCPSSYTLLYEPSKKAGAGAETYKVETADYIELLRAHPDVYKILREEAVRKRKIYRRMKREYLALQSEIANIIPRPEGDATPLERYIRRNQLEEEDEDNEKSKLLGTGKDEPIRLMKTLEIPKRKVSVTEQWEKRTKKISKTLFNKVGSKLSHKDMLLMEYEYNSEDEYGTQDIFQKEEPPKVKDTMRRKVKDFEKRIKNLTQKIDVIGEQTEQFITLAA